MRCMSCGGNIDPEWVHAIQSNTCPGCGNEIMNESTMQLLNELSEAMEKMPNDPQGVAGWLLSNYRFQKIGAAEPVEKFHRKGASVAGGGVDDSNLKVDPTYNEFIKRNGASDIVAKSLELQKKFQKPGEEKFAAMAAAISSAGDPYGDIDPGNTDIDTSEDDVPSNDEQKAYNEMKSGGFDPFKSSGIGGIGGMMGAGTGSGGGEGGRLSSLIEMSGADPNVIESLSKIMGQTAGRTSDDAAMLESRLAQTEDGAKYLQRDRFKKIKAQDAISGSGGAFRR